MDGRLTFHCAAPHGEWINDPNALYYADGRFRLLMQHSPVPEPGPVGWGSASSHDLLHWRWDGVAIPPDESGYAYSGCVVAGDAYLTRHDPGSVIQTQHRRTGIGGHDSAPIGPQGRNRRDPFVFWNARTQDWRMLVAAPCDWTDWRSDPPSEIEVWRSDDREHWSRAGSIGPWSPPGMLWEVPVCLQTDGTDILILSTVDRRDDRTDCSVRYWTGVFDHSFDRAPGCPDEGWPLDLGPDFYAAIVNTEQGWPLPERHLIAWASNWRVARPMGWGGGPLTLPRRLSLQDGRLRQHPCGTAAPLAAWRISTLAAFSLQLRRGASSLQIAVDETGAVSVRRTLAGMDEWTAHHRPGTLSPGRARGLTLITEGPLCELFIDPDGVTVTAALPGNEELTIL